MSWTVVEGARPEPRGHARVLIEQQMLMYDRRMRSVTERNRERTARLFHALSDETRLRIIQRLKDGEQCVCDLTDAFRTGQSRLSFHLRVLKDSGLVKDRPEGRWVYYSLNPSVIEDLEETVRWLKEAPLIRRSGSRCE